MAEKKIYAFCIFFMFLIFLTGIVSAAFFCCEKTKGGAWCQSMGSESDCDPNYGRVQTSCDATSYCRLGTCINQQEGNCMPNTPQKVCEEDRGFWSDKKRDDLPQCQLGCCLIGEQAAFVTHVACNRLGSLYGTNVSYRTNIKDELQCLASATSYEKGACVYEEDYVRTCKLTTQKACQDSGLSKVEFHKGYLCTAVELGTNCAPTEKTKCVENKDEVYFIDTCNNIGNVYDSSKVKDVAYWTKIQEPTCSDNAGNKNSRSCGDCDYYAGSICKGKKIGESTDYGDYICKNLDCTEYKGADFDLGSYPRHGETWCATDTKSGQANNLPGSSYYRMVCYNGEVTIEQCDVFRQKICIENNSLGFGIANCRPNLYLDCFGQNNSDDCLLREERDCQWIKDYYFYYDAAGTFGGIQKSNSSSPAGMCVPLNAPGMAFWNEGGICVLGSAQCIVKYERGLIDKWGKKPWKPIENKECLEAAWANKMNDICMSLGDCGSKVNYIGQEGYKNKDVVKTQAPEV
ncbi:MAG: hypothetical protein NTU63_02175 [Candidatus Pacearchaeota archaeon]|nr:hypothetical protein [Candidatus Pacearchaeota archaeon]